MKGNVLMQSYLVKRVADHDYNTAPQTIEEQLYAARKRIAELEVQACWLQVSKFGTERFTSSPKLIRFYTGFPNYECLKIFYQCIVPHVMTMLTWTQHLMKKKTEAT